MPTQVKTATFRGVRYAVDTAHHLHGYCELPEEKGVARRALWIKPDLGPRDWLETAVHEALHAALGSDDENVVGPAAKDVARFLWRLGYRREK